MGLSVSFDTLVAIRSLLTTSECAFVAFAPCYRVRQKEGVLRCVGRASSVCLPRLLSPGTVSEVLAHAVMYHYLPGSG